MPLRIGFWMLFNQKWVPWYGMWDYAFTFEGGVIQQAGTIITMRHNGTIREYIDMPTLSSGG